MKLTLRLCALACVLTTNLAAQAAAPRATRTKNLVLFLVDGLRWQEVFTGADETLMTKDNGVENVDALKKKYWRDTPEQRRSALMPFFWSTIAHDGVVYGDQNKGSMVHVSNEYRISYPGYSEMTVGFADPRIASNEHKPNPSVSVFEWLSQKPEYKGRVAAFGSWNALPFIFNRERSGLFIDAGNEPVQDDPPSPAQELLNRIKRDVPPRYDAPTFYACLEYVKAHKPRALFFASGETDECAHEGRYDEYLNAAARADRFIKTLWELLQSLPEYKDKTTLIVDCDHGRGTGPEWKSHGKKFAGAENVWVAVMGPDTPNLGERSDTEPLILAQVAATVAASLGEDYCTAVPEAAQPLPDAVRTPAK